MDKIKKTDSYRATLQQVTRQHAELGSSTTQPVSVAICDRDTDNYLLLDIGWDASGRRVHYVVFHLSLKDGKVWIEQDGIEYGIAQDLIANGIAPEDICFADRSPQPVALTELVAA